MGWTLASPLDDMTGDEVDALVRRANELYFRAGAWGQTSWLGYPVIKCPTDLWVYQELIVALRPQVIVETGTWAGGSALFFAHLLDLLGQGQVITIDLQPLAGRPQHPRIRYLQGDSASAEVVEEVRRAVGDLSPVMVLLDSAHRKEHVLAELRAYGPLVTAGSWLVVEDTAFDGWPVWPEFGEGPAAAVAAFLAECDRFEVEPSGRHLLTLAPGGLLRAR